MQTLNWDAALVTLEVIWPLNCFVTKCFKCFFVLHINQGGLSGTELWLQYDLMDPLSCWRTSCQSTCLYTIWLAKKKTKGFSKPSPDASPAEHLACFGGTSSLGIQSLLCESKTCICMSSPDGLALQSQRWQQLHSPAHTADQPSPSLAYWNHFSHFLLCHLSTCAHSLRIGWRSAWQDKKGDSPGNVEAQCSN